jgi:5-methyltetrahydropteroyltriglutamate--homocysteine methyltransferase
MSAIDKRPPARADHIGSLLRPLRLRQAFREFNDGSIGESEFRAIQDAAIRGVVDLQRDVGFEIVNDGEYRRGSYWSRFVERTPGLAIAPAVFKFHDEEGHEAEFTAPHVRERVRRGGPIAVDEVEFVSRIAHRIVKVTLPSPSTMHFWGGAGYADPGVYDTAEQFFADLAAVYREEIAALAASGARYVQLDEVPLAMLCDPTVRARVRASAMDPDRLVDLYVDAINRAVQGRPPSLTIGVHVCRGNFKGLHLSEGGYESVAEKLFAGADVDHFLLEYDTPRAGDFAPLRFVPKHKGVVLGLVSSKLATLEPFDGLRRRVDEASKHIDRERLGISPQCGFASTVAGNPITEADMCAKLRLVVEAARAIWS